MLKLSVTAKDSPVNIQDPRPVNNFGDEQASYTVQPNTTKEMIMSWQQLERIGQQLTDLEELSLITFVIEGTSGPGFTEQPDNPGIPVIDYVDTPSPVNTGDNIVVTGSDLLGGQELAEASIAGDTAAGSVRVRALPGGAGNDYDIEVIDSLGGGLSVAVNTVDGREVITVDLGGSAAETCTTVAAIINNPASATYGLVFAEVVGVGGTGITAARDLVALTGGSGTGMTATLAGIACVITGIDDTGAPVIAVSVATPNYSALGLAVGAPIALQLRSNGKVTTAALTAA